MRRMVIGLAAMFVCGAALGAEGEWRVRLVDDKGIDDPHNAGVARMTSHGEYLFLGSWNTQTGACVYRSKNGEQWERIGEKGLDGNPKNFAVVGFVWYGDYLYAGTWNQMEGGDLFRAKADAPLASANASDIVWETVATDGLGNPRNAGTTHLREFNGHLYAGTFNFTEGSELFRSKTGDAGTWEMVIPKGWGMPYNTDSTMMTVHDGYLYVGTECARDTQWKEGTQLWRTDGNLSPPYSQWQQVNVNGFGNPRNHNICGLATLNGKLYAGTWNQTQGLEVWRATPGKDVPFADWEKVVTSGFGEKENIFTCTMVTLNDTLFLAAVGDFATVPPLYFLPNAKLQRAHGGLLIKSSDGLNWEEIDEAGFMDPPQIGAQWLMPFQGKLYIGGAAIDSTMQLWVCEPVE